MELLTVSFQNCVLKQEFEAVQVISFFGMNNFGHVEAMKVIFFSKLSKSYVDLENLMKVGENVPGFKDNCV